MKFYRIKISSWTSSFRFPNIISGFQPTLEVPPVSTILGLINACAGRYLTYQNFKIGYYFKYNSKGDDLETIYQFETDQAGVPKAEAKSNVLHREFLFDCTLYLYLTDYDIVEYFRNPYYSILLGRSSDLASVEKIEVMELQEVKEACKLKGQVIPFKDNFLPGMLQALPKYFSNAIPRRNIGTEPFSIISYDSPDYPTKLTAFRDRIDNEEIDIFLHNLTV